jgi:hypothetical protein
MMEHVLNVLINIIILLNVVKNVPDVLEPLAILMVLAIQKLIIVMTLPTMEINVLPHVKIITENIVLNVKKLGVFALLALVPIMEMIAKAIVVIVLKENAI